MVNLHGLAAPGLKQFLPLLAFVETFFDSLQLPLPLTIDPSYPREQFFDLHT